MKIAPLVQDVPLNDFEGKADNSRPPDGAMRASAAMMQAYMENTGRLMQAAGRGGLDIVINGSNATAPRAPEKISGFNSSELAAIGALGGLAAKSAGAEKEQPKADPPASNPPPPNPPDHAPAPTVSEQPVTPTDKKETVPASPAPPVPNDKQGHKKKPTPDPKPTVTQKKPEQGQAADAEVVDPKGDGAVAVDEKDMAALAAMVFPMFF